MLSAIARLRSNVVRVGTGMTKYRLPLCDLLTNVNFVGIAWIYSTNAVKKSRRDTGRCVRFFLSIHSSATQWLLCYCSINSIGKLLVTEGKVEVTDVGIGVFIGCHIDLENDTVARCKSTGRWVSCTSGCLHLPTGDSTSRDGGG